MFSQAVEYSLRAMVLLAASGNDPVTVQSMADRGQIPAPYLSKLLQGLARAGLIISQRGIGGGYRLSRNPAEISLADIVRVVDPMQRITNESLETSVSKIIGSLNHKLDQTIALVENYFEKTTMEELQNDKLGPSPLCSPQPLVSLDLDFPKQSQKS